MTTYSVNQPVTTNLNQRWWRWAPWMSRFLLVPPTLIMMMVSIRCISDPMHALVRSGVTLGTPEAITDMRAVGGITLTLAASFMWAIFSRGRLRIGHGLVIALMAFVLAVRMFGFVQDGTTLAMGTQKVKFFGEIIFLTLNALGFALQTYVIKRRRIA